MTEPESEPEPEPVPATLSAGQHQRWELVSPGTPDTSAMPLYRLAPDGPEGLATGRVFVRWAEGERAMARGADLLAAGYSIEESPAWAPHTAFVRAASGSLAASLSGIERLQAVRGVVNVEPEILRRRAWKEPDASDG